MKVFCLLVVLMLTGCANTLVMKDGPLDLNDPINLLVTPVQSVGVAATRNVKDGAITIVEAPVADKCISAEMYPGRIRWNGLAVNKEGEEFFTQFVLSGMYKSGEYRFSVIIEGDKEKLRDANVVLLSSKGEFVCNFEGVLAMIDAARFRNERAYRAETIKKEGSRVGKRHRMSGFEKNVQSWNLYSTYQGEVFTPYGDEDFKTIARINPGYNLLDKVVLNGKVTISTNPIYTLWTIGSSIIEGMTAKSQGWDYMSQLPDRLMMGQIVEFIGKLRLEVIRQLNEEKEVLKILVAKKIDEEKSKETIVAAKVETPKVETAAVKKNPKKKRKE
ncbi:MAG: hypothetical protein WCI36_04070 [bacterium]